MIPAIDLTIISLDTAW